MLFEIEFLERRSIVIDTFDLTAAQALVEKWVADENAKSPGKITVLCVAPVERTAEAA